MNSAVCLHNATVLTGLSTMEDCAVYVKNGKIAEIYSEQRFKNRTFSSKVKIIDVGKAYVLPGLIDTHIHGIGGFCTDDASQKSILKMSEMLAQFGITSFIPTISATPEPEIYDKIKAVLHAMGKEHGARILGIHLEGPFLSPERVGAQDVAGISPVDLAYMKRLYKACKGHLINMTVAPELKNMREVALYANEKGIVLQAGHTNATYAQMVEGMQANIMHSTHIFNAMRPLHHREPGTVGAILTHPEISCEIIGDGVHVNPNLIHLLLKSKPLSQLVLISDSLKYAQTAIPDDIDLYFDQCFKRKSDDTICGSGITTLDGFRNLVSYGIPPEKVIRMAAANPARIMNQTDVGLLLPGKRADIIVLDKDLNLIHTLIGGKFIKEN